MEPLIITGLLILGAFGIATIIYIIGCKRYKNYINSIQVGDIFVSDFRIDSYYRSIEEYKHEQQNPFKKPDRFWFPQNTCIIREFKTNEQGEIWVAYSFIKTSDDIHSYELYKHYKSLDDFLRYRTRVKPFNI